ncbi:MAG: glycosyltransferase, partial [Rhizorhabdus sp.]|nr:glycosyltransferase [Rhizorhabdus sp.]
LGTLYARVSGVCRSIPGLHYEIILINDGSKDATWSIISDLAAQDASIMGVDLSRNHGHQLALTAGLAICRGDKILILDADLQDPPELLQPMLDLMAERQADVVYGQRRHRESETLFKRVTASAFYRLLRSLSDIEIPLDTGDFRLMTRRALNTILAMPESNRFVRGMVSWAGFTQVAFVYNRNERHAGETKYPLSKMLKLTFDALTGFSIAPLRMASLIGVALGGLAFVMIAYTIQRWFAGEVIPGWTSLMCVVVMLGSIQLTIIGIFGEYLGRIYIETKGRPLFVIRNVIGSESDRIPAPQGGFYDPSFTAHRVLDGDPVLLEPTERGRG